MPLCPTAPLPAHAALLAGAALHLARGFGAKRGSSSSTPDSAAGADADADAGAADVLRPLKKRRRKIVPCPTCKGSGNKPCQFCDGTTLMVGFLGKRVPCVPCRGKATLGRPCVDCKGLGYFTP